MILAPSAFIKAGMVAYHLKGNIIDDSMRLSKGGYCGEPVAKLMHDGWTFVCSNNQFKKGKKIGKKDMGSVALALKQCNEMDRREIRITVKGNLISATSSFNAQETIKILMTVVNKTIGDITNHICTKK